MTTIAAGSPPGPDAGDRASLSLAAALLATGRAAIGRSFRFHRPRGAFCHAGWCQQCRIATPDGPALACEVSAGAAPRPAAFDPLRIIGRTAEAFPPWFHEHRVPGPARLRQLHLDCLRRLSAAPALTETFTAAAAEGREMACHTLVAGGGLSGLNAARDLAAAGRDVVLCEAKEFGGAARFELARSGLVEAAIEAAANAGARLLACTLVAGLYEEPRRALAVDGAGPIIIRFEELVVATGACDRLPAFHGNDLPGIVGARAFARLAATGAVLKDWRIAAVGHQENLATVEAVALARGLKLALTSTLGVAAANGRGRIRSVRLAGGRQEAVDLLVLALSQPGYELQLQAGMAAGLAGSPPVVVPIGKAHLPLRIVGRAAGTIAPRAEDGAAGWPAPDPCSFVCLCEDVRVEDLDRAIADGFDDIELLKRRTGAGTGPCQGKLCHAEIAACLARNGRAVALPTQRPLVRPVRLATLAAGR